MTDKYLMQLWRYAVLAEHNCRCYLCGHPYIDELECHHIVRRANRVLRWDWRNGVPLCAKCHRLAHTRQGQRLIESKLGLSHVGYLDKYERVTVKDYLMENRLSYDEFKKQLADELKAKRDQ